MKSGNAKFNNTHKIREIINRLDKKNKSKSREASFDKPSKTTYELRRLSKKSSNSKSLAFSNRFIARDMSSGSKHYNDYGLKNIKSRKSQLKSFNPTYYPMTTLGIEGTILGEKEIDQYLKLLNNYVRSDQTSKVVATLKLLLHHFLRKQNTNESARKSGSRVKNSNSMLSPISKEKSSKDLSKDSSTKKQPESVALSLRQNFSENERFEEIEEKKKKFRENKNTLTLKTSRKYTPKEIEFNLDELKTVDVRESNKIKKFDLTLDDYNKIEPVSSDK